MAENLSSMFESQNHREGVGRKRNGEREGEERIKIK